MYAVGVKPYYNKYSILPYPAQIYLIFAHKKCAGGTKLKIQKILYSKFCKNAR